MLKYFLFSFGFFLHLFLYFFCMITQSLEGAGALWAGLPAALAVLLVDEVCRFVMQQARLWYIKHKHSVHGVLKNTGGY